MRDLQLVIDAKAPLAEGPNWDREKKLLYWVDIVGQSVHIYDPVSGEDRTIPTGMMTGAVVKRSAGGLAIAAEQGVYALDPETELLELLVGSGEADTNRFNDGKCDAAGRFWVGTMPKAGGPPTGSFYCLEKDGRLRHLFGDVGCSNGIAWSPDKKTMYYIDSPTKQVSAFDVDPETGEIANRRVALTIPEGEGVPDGMTSDDEGMLWIAQWGGWKVSRWDPRTGERLSEIAVPAAQVTSCAFGGDELDELYITTARVGLDEEALAKQPHAGGVFRIKLGVSGAASHPYQG
ncbi:SMP-30/gluconolactonase/LRE family protein [Paenibacillus sp. TRM 82003]|nr:SMP-30/gluconolactonase/LRE family protein [Paenibacillus sp. TRM 82003]